MEVWKDVVGYECIYKISSLGEVKSVKSDKLLYKSKRKNGYLSVCLFKEKTRRTRLIHTIVANAFIDHLYIDRGMVVNHINFIRDDNRLENLEVTTYRENTNRKHIKSSSKYVGVSWNSKNKKWVSSIRIGSVRKYLGCFDSEEEAYEYYNFALDAINQGNINGIKLKRIIR